MEIEHMERAESPYMYFSIEFFRNIGEDELISLITTAWKQFAGFLVPLSDLTLIKMNENEQTAFFRVVKSQFSSLLSAITLASEQFILIKHSSQLVGLLC
ncbi:hypothetical protein PCE1_003822 [Barthelona sp. PCE]